MAFWYLFDFSIKEAGCINIALGHSLLEATCDGFSKEKTLFNCLDRSWIWGFGNVYGIKIMAKLGSVTHQIKLLEKPEGMKKDKIALKKLGLIVRPDGI